MAEKDKRYYWLRLKRDFFKRHDIRIIEAMPNGKDYILFYLKLLCESVDHEGKLRFSDSIPYSEEMLATITNTNVDIVRSAVKIFTELNMMEIIDDGTYYMKEVERMIGSESYWAERKRLQRTENEEMLDNNWTMSNEIGQCPTCPSKSKSKSKSKSIDINKEKDKEKDKRESIPYQLIADMYNETCVSLPRVTAMSEARKKAIKARMNSYTLDDFKKLFQKAEQSDFLKGKNDRNWSANFDWLLKDSNMAKTLDGNYDNRNGGKEHKPAEPTEKSKNDLKDIEKLYFDKVKRSNE